VEEGADVAGVPGLNGEDGTSDSEVGLVEDGGGGAEVGGHADAFEDGGEGSGVDVNIWI